MKLFFEGKNNTFFSTYKLTLKPGENTVPDELGAELLSRHADACNRGAVKDKPRITTDVEGEAIRKKLRPTEEEKKAAAKSKDEPSSSAKSGSVKEAAKSILGGVGKTKDTASTKGEK